MRCGSDGSPISATVEITNHTGTRIRIPNACNGWASAGLVNEHVSFDPGRTLIGCRDAFLRTGTSRVRVSLGTTYSECRQGSATSAPGVVPCEGPGRDRMPLLEPGEYRTKVELATQPRIPPPPSLAVTLLP